MHEPHGVHQVLRVPEGSSTGAWVSGPVGSRGMSWVGAVDLQRCGGLVAELSVNVPLSDGLRVQCGVLMAHNTSGEQRRVGAGVDTNRQQRGEEVVAHEDRQMGLLSLGVQTGWHF